MNDSFRLGILRKAKNIFNTCCSFCAKGVDILLHMVISFFDFDGAVWLKSYVGSPIVFLVGISF